MGCNAGTCCAAGSFLPWATLLMKIIFLTRLVLVVFTIHADIEQIITLLKPMSHGHEAQEQQSPYHLSHGLWFPGAQEKGKSEAEGGWDQEA